MPFSVCRVITANRRVGRGRDGGKLGGRGIQMENVEGNVLERGTRLCRGGYCCFEHSFYRQNESKCLKTIHGLENAELRVQGLPTQRSFTEVGEWPLLILGFSTRCQSGLIF